MFTSMGRSLLLKVMLLFWGHGLFCSISIIASPREQYSIDSIAAVVLSRGNLMYGTINHQQIKPEIQLRSSQLSEKAKRFLGTEEAFYVYKDANGDAGFAIVSTDDLMPEVLAYSYDELFCVDKMPSSVRYWLECYIDNFLNKECLPVDTKQNYINPAEVRSEGVPPILGKLPWGQGEPYNNICPFSPEGRSVVGCVATAMSQVMWLHKWPDCGKGDINYSTRTHQIRVKMNLSDYPFQWNLIKEEYHKGQYTESEGNAVATLMAACGAAVHMDYSSNGSGAFQEDILRALVSNFNYDPDAAFLPREYFTSADWQSMLISELNAGRAVNYAGQSRTDGGHSFVIDGYEATNDGGIPYYHLNWGWNGLCNGYYSLPSLRPVENDEYFVDEGFTQGQQMLVGVQPDNGQRDANKMLYAQGIKVMQSLLKPGEASTLKVNEISNLCYRTFSGSVALQLQDEEENTIIAGRLQIEPMSYLESKKNLSIPFVVPENLEEGKYTVRVVGLNDEGGQSLVYSRSLPQITVSKNPYGDEIVSAIPLLCSSEFEVIKRQDNSGVNVRVYELFNYSDELLEGDLQLEIASYEGNSITNIGIPIHNSAIEPQEVEPVPIILFGSIPDTLSNGCYRLYVQFFPMGQTIGNRVQFYDRTDTNVAPEEYYLSMEVNSDEIIVNGVHFVRTTSNKVSLEMSSSTSFFSLSGIKGRKHGRGIYIMTKDNGETYKVMSVCE